MTRPFITPDDLIAYTTYESVKSRSTSQLEVDIARGELYAMHYCGQDFSDVEEDTPAAECLVLAVKILAEMYAYNAQLKTTIVNESNGGHSVRSESSQDYSYTYSSTEEDVISIQDLGIEVLLEPLCVRTHGDTELWVTIL